MGGNKRNQIKSGKTAGKEPATLPVLTSDIPAASTAALRRRTPILFLLPVVYIPWVLAPAPAFPPLPLSCLNLAQPTAKDLGVRSLNTLTQRSFFAEASDAALRRARCSPPCPWSPSVDAAIRPSTPSSPGLHFLGLYIRPNIFRPCSFSLFLFLGPSLPRPSGPASPRN